METRDEHDTSCPGDDELVAFACAENDSAELATHLEQCESCADHVRTLKEMRQAVRELKSGRPESSTRNGILEADESEPLTSGTSPDELSSVGKYRIISCLGEGGQATVYRAVHPVMEREVIIKLRARDQGNRPQTASRRGRPHARAARPPRTRARA